MITPNTNVGEAKFTPGPWYIDWKPTDDEGYRISTEPGTNAMADDPVGCVWVATVYDGDCGAPGPDAHLIAAAPQMFEALEDALEFIKGHCKNQLTWSDIDERIEEVLALARGEALTNPGEKGAEG